MRIVEKSYSETTFDELDAGEVFRNNDSTPQRVRGVYMKVVGCNTAVSLRSGRTVVFPRNTTIEPLKGAFVEGA